MHGELTCEAFMVSRCAIALLWEMLNKASKNHVRNGQPGPAAHGSGANFFRMSDGWLGKNFCRIM